MTPATLTRALPLVLLVIASASHARISGCWISEEGTSVIELSEQAGKVTGRVMGLEDPLYLEEEDQGTPGSPRVDLNNPEPALRARPIAGLAIVQDLVQDGDEWDDGSIYDPESGKTYSVKAEVDRKGMLNLRGYIGTPMFGRTTTWGPASARPDDTQRMVTRLAPFLPEDATPADCAR